MLQKSLDYYWAGVIAVSVGLEILWASALGLIYSTSIGPSRTLALLVLKKTVDEETITNGKSKCSLSKLSMEERNTDLSENSPTICT
jgi:hypothetical protein